MSESPSGPVSAGPAPLVPFSDGSPRSSGVSYQHGWPADLESAAILKSIRKGGGSWRSVTIFPQIGSTNTVGLAMAAAGAPTGAILVSDVQTAGRGRLDRSWEAPAGTACLFSVVVHPDGPDHALGILPLLTGVAVAEAVEFVTGIRVSLKWPNDLVIRDEDAPSGHGGKVGGLLAERDEATEAIVLGVGINADLAAEDLPVPGATSLTLAGIPRPRRAKLIGRALSRIEHWFTAWDAVGTDAEALDKLLGAYRERCISVGAEVSVSRPGAADLQGTGIAIGPGGELVVEAGGEQVSVTVGDVSHASAR